MHPRSRVPTTVPFDIKSLRPDGIFEGYASLFNREDLGRDVILPGAFAESLRKRSAGNIKMLFQHDPAEPIGVWETIHEDAKGLYVRGRLLADVARAKEVLALMKARALDGLSIGFKAIVSRRERPGGVRRISKVDLWEISIVTFPMMPDARVSVVKSDPPAASAVPRRHDRDLDRLIRANTASVRRDLPAAIRAATRLVRP